MSQAKRKSAGRRANYAPAAHEVGTRKYLPYGWANWLGFCLFLFVGSAMAVAVIQYVADGMWADAIAATAMAAALFVMVYLFATTRLRLASRPTRS